MATKRKASKKRVNPKAAALGLSSQWKPVMARVKDGKIEATKAVRSVVTKTKKVVRKAVNPSPGANVAARKRLSAAQKAYFVLLADLRKKYRLVPMPVSAKKRLAAAQKRYDAAAKAFGE